MGPSDGDFKQPLIKVESGYDVETHRPTIRRELKRVLVNRWSEVMSAFCLTIFLFGLAVLFCYCMGVRPSFLSKFKEQKPATDVYFHHIIQGKRYLQFAYYSDFLSYMAVEYPSLQFNIFFLVNESMQNPYPIPMSTTSFTGLRSNQKNRDAFEEETKQELLPFVKSHPNVNITIMHLSKFMAMTPLEYKWKTIPVSYLSFYARVFSVWQNGGIGMDLAMFNERFHRKLPFDRRISAILKNHDGGLPETDYKVLLETIGVDEERETSEEQAADPKVDQKPLNISQANTDTTDTESPENIVLVCEFVEVAKMSNPAHVALHSNGTFIAATEKLHGFLDMLITAGLQGRRPSCAIQNHYIT